MSYFGDREPIKLSKELLGSIVLDIKQRDICTVVENERPTCTTWVDNKQLSSNIVFSDVEASKNSVGGVIQPKYLSLGFLFSINVSKPGPSHKGSKSDAEYELNTAECESEENHDEQVDDTELRRLICHQIRIQQEAACSMNALSPEYTKKLQKWAKTIHSNPMQAWSEQNGQHLRLGVRNHRTICGGYKTCALSAVIAEGYITSRPYLKYSTCLVHLCTVPLEGETEGSCFEYCYSMSELKKRKYCRPGFEYRGKEDAQEDEDENKNE